MMDLIQRLKTNPIPDMATSETGSCMTHHSRSLSMMGRSKDLTKSHLIRKAINLNRSIGRLKIRLECMKKHMTKRQPMSRIDYGRTLGMIEIVELSLIEMGIGLDLGDMKGNMKSSKKRNSIGYRLEPNR